MATDHSVTIALVDSVRHRADCLALSLKEKAGCEAVVFTRPDLAALVSFAVILIDLDIGLEHALQLTRAITARKANAKVILLDLIESEQNVIRAAEDRVSGHVSPEDCFQRLISVLGSVQNGEFTCSPRVNYYLFAHLEILSQSNPTSKLRERLLTTRERHVLELLSLHLSNREIAERLSLSPFTVKNHVHRILRKLSVRNRWDARAIPRWTRAASCVGLETRPGLVMELEEKQATLELLRSAPFRIEP
jgi:DNA-binding NarL/FixJ family response regulator